MTKRVVSRPDAELVDALRKRGIDVNARQLERYRQAKLLLEQPQEHPGRGKGTISHLPKGAVERVVEVKAILDRHRDLRDALFVLFMRDREIGEDALKEAYRLASSRPRRLLLEAGAQRPANATKPKFA